MHLCIQVHRTIQEGLPLADVMGRAPQLHECSILNKHFKAGKVSISVSTQRITTAMLAHET